jgi:hypothetical protein
MPFNQRTLVALLADVVIHCMDGDSPALFNRSSGPQQRDSVGVA